MDVEVTSATAKVARAYHVSPEELAFADLVAVGWEQEDAWAVAIRKGLTWTKTARRDAISQLLANDAIQQRITNTKGVLAKQQVESVKSEIAIDAENIFERATNKSKKIIELQARLEASSDTNEWLKINQQIIDITRMKQEETKKDDNTVHIFLPERYPESCEYCIRNKKKKK